MYFVFEADLYVCFIHIRVNFICISVKSERERERTCELNLFIYIKKRSTCESKNLETKIWESRSRVSQQLADSGLT